MKINVPFKSAQEVVPLIDAGADELYCGYLDPAWEKEYTSLEFERKGGASNFTDLKELGRALDLAHRRGVPVALAVNGLYVREQYPLLARILRRLSRLPIDAYIVADLGLLLTLREQSQVPRLHVSTGGTVFNSQACAFFSDLGAARIVFDRQTDIGGMGRMINAFPSVEFEAFVLNTLCVHIDGFCTFMHAYAGRHMPPRRQKDSCRLDVFASYDLQVHGDACALQYQVGVNDAVTGGSLPGSAVRPTMFKHLSDGTECGACALYDLARAGVASVKIVGRQLDAGKRLLDTRFIKQSSLLLQDAHLTREGYFQAVEDNYRKAFGYPGPCRGNNCYYPQVRGF